MLTLDEAIHHCREKAKELRKEADLFSNSPAYSESTTAGCLECAKEHEQLAVWLMELKERREKDDKNYSIGYRDGTLDARHHYENQNRKWKGEWIFTDDDYGFWHCNQCKAIGSPHNNFCPNCGANMKGGAE